MRLPPDWDEPSPENKEVCDRFTYNTFDYSGVLPYRLFVPSCTVKVPLVMYFHGADAFGKDNELQLTMHDIGTMFARDEWQQTHPCYVCAPQCNVGNRWSNLMTQNRVCALIKSLEELYSNIDAERIYIYGYCYKRYSEDEGVLCQGDGDAEGNGNEWSKEIMESILIKDTTREQREQIVAESIGNINGSCDGCMAGLVEMYQDYIDGKKEIREINMEFRAHYESGIDGPEKADCRYKA